MPHSSGALARAARAAPTGSSSRGDRPSERSCGFAGSATRKIAPTSFCASRSVCAASRSRRMIQLSCGDYGTRRQCLKDTGASAPPSRPFRTSDPLSALNSRFLCSLAKLFTDLMGSPPSGGRVACRWKRPFGWGAREGVTLTYLLRRGGRAGTAGEGGRANDSITTASSVCLTQIRPGKDERRR